MALCICCWEARFFSISGAQTSDQQRRHNLNKSKLGLLCLVASVPCSAKLSHSFPKQYYNSQKCGWIKAWYIRTKVAWGTRCLIRFIGPMPEATFFVSLAMWLLQSSLFSMVTPSNFAVVTWLTWLSQIVIVGETARVLTLCLELMSINSVLVIFRVSLFALNQLRTYSESWPNWRPK